PGKWTIKEVLAHLIDTERVFGYRALHFARGDASPLPGFDQDAWSPTTWAAGRSLPSVLGEWQAVRRAFLAFAEGLDPELLDRRGIASGREFSVRAPLFIVVGHVEYHLAHLREHYL
ncbi:MAG: DinB family protein, partial [Thermoanaerobaculia bacterium]|nr:DinB family protein [Thermoanaerobaculia bacterium]